MNNGEPLADGTVYHVISAFPFAYEEGQLIPFGSMLTADADPGMEGSQVAVENGVIQLDLVFPDAAIPSARVIVFSDEGTAFGDETILLTAP